VQLNHTGIAILVIAVGGIVAGSYVLGKKQGEAAAPSPAVHGAAAPGQVGQGHPVLAQADAGEQDKEGKVVPIDPNKKFIHYRVGNKNVKSMFLDGKVLWVGTSGGVVRYDMASDEFKHWDARNGLLSNGVFHVSKLEGKIAVGTYGGGLSLLDEKTGNFENLNIPQGLGDAFVYDVLQAKNGDVWIATWSGVNRVRGGALRDRSKWDLYTVENTGGGLPNDWVYGLAEGKNGDLWLATEGGLALYRDGKWQNWNHAKGLGAPYEKVKDAIAFKSDPGQVSMHHAKQKEEMGLQDVSVAFNPNYIVAIEVDKDGVVWVGTWGGGLSRYDGKAWTSLTTKEGLPGNHVFMLHIDRNGLLWVGTNNGLAKLRDGKFEVMTAEDGLFNNNVFSMTTGDDGALWVGSFGGVAYLKPGEKK
jgi:ligand-binding sensor domain-containing protein